MEKLIIGATSEATRANPDYITAIQHVIVVLCTHQNDA
jgi:hypothetical protein